MATYTWAVAQVTIYLPESVEKAVRREAKRARKSVSAYIADLARAQVSQSTWPDEFGRLYGSWHGKFPDVVDRRAEPVEL